MSALGEALSLRRVAAEIARCLAVEPDPVLRSALLIELRDVRRDADACWRAAREDFEGDECQEDVEVKPC